MQTRPVSSVPGEDERCNRENLNTVLNLWSMHGPM